MQSSAAFRLAVRVVELLEAPCNVLVLWSITEEQYPGL